MGTNKKRARCFCFRHFAVVIRHLISHPQRCQNLRQTSQQKFEGMRKPCNGYEGPPFDDQIAVPCRNAIDGEGHFLRARIGLDERLTNDHLPESFISLNSIGYERQEWREREVFHRIKSLICRKKSSFRDKTPRIAESDFRITIIRAIFVQIFNRLFI